MGCDIHAYPEYRTRTAERDATWSSFGGRINPGRNYALFGHLAGVRNPVKPVVEPRGYPDDAGWHATGDYRVHISEKYGDEDGYTTPERAAKWVEHGCSSYLLRDGVPYAVTDPDAHTASWVTPDEFAEAIKRAESDWPRDAVEYRALLAALRQIEGDGYEARLVFWFDN